MKGLGTFEKYLSIVLKKMCEIVDADPDEIDFKSQDWYRQHSWNQHQERYFKEWFILYLKQDSKARNGIMQYPTLTKLDEYVDCFVFQFGWIRNDYE